ncbi:MAG: transketolase C-terminal domain-containing protein [Clostridia bacterium]|nr:transketolase C-terminal domain-containing protein [Clostridia bacterium]
MTIEYNGQLDARSFKDVLGSTIPAMLEADSDIIYLDADLMSCIGTKKYADAHPDRAINCGIAEANMMGVAAGLAAAGFKPVCHTFGPFASRRSFDQVFLSAGYAGNDITVIGSDPGVCAAFNGGTHMPFEDVALYRAIPTATIIDITDAYMLEELLPKVVDIPGVKYIRVGRKNNPHMYAPGTRFTVGKGNVLKDGSDVAIIACGIMVGKAMAAAAELEKDGINAAVIDMFTIKPLDSELVLKYAQKTGAVVVCENHNKIGGLYSAVTELLARERPTFTGCVAVEDKYGEVGPQDYLEKSFDLTSEHIISEVKKTITMAGAAN